MGIRGRDDNEFQEDEGDAEGEGLEGGVEGV